MSDIKAIIADDELHIRTYLKSKLSVFWPELQICGEAGDGFSALNLIQEMRPDVAFLDIQMPGLSGIDIAQKIAEISRVVFITAHEDYAVEAFESEAVDYLLKPVTEERLLKMIDRLKKRLAQSPLPSEQIISMINQMTQKLTTDKKNSLQWIRAHCRDGIRVVPVKNVYYFTKKDNYTAVVTRKETYLVSKTIKELIQELDKNQFCQIHRATIVNLNFIEKVSRSITGRGVIKFVDLHETLTISRSYLHLFKQM